MTAFDHLETPLDEPPLFPVEKPGKPDPLRPDLWPEQERQAEFIAFMAKYCQSITVRAVRNEGKRGFREQRQMRRTGLRAGTFDCFVAWHMKDATRDCPATLCWIEWKGFDARGRPGKLSPAQIEFGNAMHRKGFKVACFYTVKPALSWLESLGAPIRGRVT